jgi:hypothetical protein
MFSGLIACVRYAFEVKVCVGRQTKGKARVKNSTRVSRAK